MVWFLAALVQIGLYVGTAILSALLDRRSNPDTPPGEPQFPKADAQAPIPVIYGTTRVGINVVHLANRTLGENTIRNGALSFGWSSTKIGYFYYVDLLAVIGWGPLGALHEVYVDGVKKLTDISAVRTATLAPGIGITYTAAAGISPTLPDYLYPLVTSRAYTVTAGELLGGKLSRGGIGAGGDTGSAGTMRIWPGTGAIEHNTRLETLHGSALPVYPNVATVALEDNFYMGNSEQLPGIEFVVSRMPDVGFLGTGYIGNVTANAGRGGNPAGILWDLLTNPWYGLGISAAELDAASFLVLAQATDTGVSGSAAFDVPISFVLDGKSTGKAVLADLLRTLDGVLAIDPETGLLTVWLLRGPTAPHYGYTPGTTVVDESMISSLVWTDGLPDAQVNAITVEFIDRDRDYTKNTVTARNVAAIQALGREEARTVSFLGVQDADLAMRLAQRELQATTTGMGRASIVTNRKGFNLMPGRSFSLDWAPRGFTSKTMRVVSVRDEHLGGVTIDAVEDVYASDAPSFAVETTPEPTPPVSYPTLAPYGYLETSVSGTATGTATLFLFDPSGVVTLVEHQTTSGTDAASGWVTDTYPYTATVTRSAYAPSTVEFRVTYTDAAADPQTLTFTATFDADADTLSDAVDAGTEAAASVGTLAVPVAGVEDVALATIATSSTEIDTRYRVKRYLVGAGLGRVHVTVTAASGSGATAAWGYSTDDFGTAATPFAPVSIAATGQYDSGWVAIPAAMASDVKLTPLAAGGGGTASATFSSYLEVLPGLVTALRDHADDFSDDFS